MRRRRRLNICSMLSFSNAGPSKLGASTKQQEYAPKVICCSFMFSLLLKLRDFASSSNPDARSSRSAYPAFK
jgi:hypothetical protein